jgi:hypothetical protein
MIDPFDGLTNRTGGPGPFEEEGNVTSSRVFTMVERWDCFLEWHVWRWEQTYQMGMIRDGICYQWDISTRPHQIDSLLPLSVP